MSKISSSPERNTFQKENYVKRQEEQGLEPLEEYIEMFKTWKQQDEANLIDPTWQKNNMEYDLRSNEWMCANARASDTYAQNLYAAMCNNDFQKLDVLPILKEETWSCSWRHSGGVIADMRESGDYMDWYCSGIRGDKLSDSEFADLTEAQKVAYLESQAYVSESMVTDEIRADLFRLGWLVVDSKESILV